MVKFRWKAILGISKNIADANSALWLQTWRNGYWQATVGHDGASEE